MPHGKFASANQNDNLNWLVTRPLYGISAFVPQTSFHRETVGGVTKIITAACQANLSIKFPLPFAPVRGYSLEWSIIIMGLPFLSKVVYS